MIMNKSLTIKVQLIAVISILSLMLATFGWLGINHLNQTVRSLHSIYVDRVLPLEQLKVVSDMYAVNIVDTVHKTRNGNLDWTQSLSNITEAEQKIHNSWTTYLTTVLVDDEKRLIEQIIPLMQSANESITRLKIIVQKEDAKALASYTIIELYPKIEPITEKISELIAVQLFFANAEYQSGHEIYAKSRLISLVTIPLSIFIASFIGFLFYRSMVRGINSAHEYFMKMANGDVDITIEMNCPYELNKILEAAGYMKTKLVADVAQANENANEFARIKVALDNVSTNVMIADNDRKIIYVNQSAVKTLKQSQSALSEQFSGIDLDKLVGTHIDQFHRNPSHQKQLLAALSCSHETQITMVGKIFRLTANPVITHHQHRLGSVVEWEDVTEKIALQQKLEDQAQIDFLTELANRRYFMELAEQELLRVRRYQSDLSVFMLDIDHFKKINDTYGHKAGDLVLQQFAKTCQIILREVDIVGRLGGEEFAVLLPNTSGVLALDIAERLLKAFQDDSVELGAAKTVKFTVSIGVAILSNDGQSIDEMLQEADAALYQAKNTGRNKVVASF